MEWGAKMFCWCSFAFLILSLRFLPGCPANTDVFHNPHDDSQPFQHLVVDRLNTGRVYIGAVNRLYELHPDLKVKSDVTTGPREDSADCLGPSRECTNTEPTDNYNKALAIVGKMSKLVECSSLYQGRCRLRNLYNIAQSGNASGAIVANDQHSSTVVFVAPGPPDPSKSDVLYVASTYTDLGTFRDEIPAVASLSLDVNSPGKLFSVARKTIKGQTQIFVERSKRKSYKIEYVTGFSSGNFSYFVSRQPKLDTGPSRVLSKLVRLCHADSNYYSYTEVPLVCRKNSVNYNLVQDAYLARPGFDLARSLGITTEDDVLFAVFSEGDKQNSLANQPTRNSALCVYSLRMIEQKFLENIQLCNRGEAVTGLGYFSRNRKCLQTRFPAGNDISCGNEVNYPLGGEIPIANAPVLTSTDSRLTAVTATTTHSYTVVFMGTADGMLKKGVVESESYGFEYNTIEVDRGMGILADMDLDISGEYLFIMTSERVWKLKVHDCQGRDRCMDCLRARDPYCGWCALENRCTIRSECTALATNKHWLPYKDAQCTTISRVTPNKLQITSSRYLRLEVENLPTVNGQLSCVFTVLGRSHLTGAQIDPEGILSCPTPLTNVLPRIPSGEHKIVVTLSVQIDEGPEFASTNFTFFDCSTYDSCSSCVQSPFPCDWCVESHQCTHNAEDDCRNDHIINGMNRQGVTTRRGPSYCPHIYSATPEIYVPSGSKKSIVVQSENILDFQTNFQCEFKIGHSLHKRGAKKYGDEIRCEEMEFSYFGNGAEHGTEVAKFSVVWQRGKALDNVQNIRVIMYKCEKLAKNCGLCLTLDSSKFICGWCSDINACTTEIQCQNSVGSRSVAEGWLGRADTCPNPRILKFSPVSGPVAGGTEVTITGINLGRSFDDIRGAVQINNVACLPKEDEYEVSTKIVCVTSRPVYGKPSQGPVVIKLKDDMKYVTVSDDRFYFVDPVITGFQPTEGPKAGGTDVIIRGVHLDAGSHVNGSIAGVPCEVRSRNNDTLVCRTGRSTTEKSGAIVMFFDNEKEEFVKQQFSFRRNPLVTSARPERSISSGGLNVEFRGDNFELLQRVRMFLSFAGENHFSSDFCRVILKERMLCKTPNLKIPDDDRLQPTVSRPLFLDYGLEMDGTVQILSQIRPKDFNRMEVFPDPKIHKFPGNRIRYFKDDYLTINGQNLNAAAKEDDVSIRIGKSWCNLTALAAPALTCRPPATRPDPVDDQKPHPEVEVKIGNTKYSVGYLSYQKEEKNLLGVPMETIVAIAVAVGGFIVAIIVLLYAYRRKSTRHLRQMKYLKSQMDSIEMKVASECKEAFAELQTSMSEMTQEMAVGIPFLPYRDYSAQVLFPNSINHPVLRDLEVEPHRAPLIEKGLRQFNQLLMNKTFLLLFVRTMEANKYFLSKDRVYVGSLLMVILQEKMEYCTDILKTLLADLIEKTVERRYQPKILFRRSESVAERMLAAWFTFLMHRYLIECAGHPLFMLYWAIKQQIEKGPQDAITQEARYSLSEEKLLRQSVDFRDFTVFVSGLENGQQNMETGIRVLDCDTITQVKEKCLDGIYRTTPFSRRPSANDLDLEWRTGGSGRLILQDVDMTTKSEPGGWKRMNTLAHYKVTNNASLVLIPRQASMYNLSLLSEKSDKSSTFSLKNSPTLTRALSPLAAGNNKDPETGYKIYHLTKPNEHCDSTGAGQDRPGAKLVSEIYLTRLLTTKGTLQKFTEDLLEAIFSTAHRGSTLPLCIKYMFDFMDDQALTHAINDPEVVHAWKSNALPLRFWVNLLKNPHFVFDIPKPTKIEGCLSVVAQTLMDACSTQDHQLTKDSPSSKLLFARDILTYREWVDRYYQDIARAQPISDQDMSAFLAEESRCHQQQGPQFNVYSALNELYKYLEQYKDQISAALDEDEFAKRNRLPTKFDQMLRMMEGDVYGTT